VTLPQENRAAPDWLALRRATDAAAREAALPLVARLTTELAPGPVTVFDIGAGTGANQEWLERRLGMPSVWVLLDHDPDLLGSPLHGTGRRVLGGVEALDALVAATPGPRLLTCSALLDVLDAAQLDGLAASLVKHSVPGLFALSVDGSFDIDQADPDDPLVRAAFNDHQRRAGRPGPHAPAYLEARCRALGCDVHRRETPWLLDGGSHGPLLSRMLRERADAAAAQRPQDAHAIRSWLDRRLHRLDRSLSVRIGHVDLLVLPPG
jgi:hypothetical protein